MARCLQAVFRCEQPTATMAASDFPAQQLNGQSLHIWRRRSRGNHFDNSEAVDADLRRLPSLRLRCHRCVMLGIGWPVDAALSFEVGPGALEALAGSSDVAQRR
jgi:hypothetical protein